MQQILDRRMLRRGQRQFLRFELLPLQRFHLWRGSFGPIWNRTGHLLWTSHDEAPTFNKNKALAVVCVQMRKPRREQKAVAYLEEALCPELQ